MDSQRLLNKAFIAILSIVLTVVTQTTFAQTEGGSNGGGGGYTVKKQGQYLLQDLFEGGVTHPTISNINEDPTNARQRLLKTNIPKDTQVLLADKLNQIFYKVPSLSFLLLEKIEKIDWSFTDASLIRPDDIGWTPMKLGQQMLYPAAVRANEYATVTVRTDIWNSMPAAHRVALIIHEAIRYIAALSYDPSRDDIVVYNNTPDRTGFPNRDFVAILFRDNFSLQDSNSLIEKFKTLVNPTFPLISYEQYLAEHTPSQIQICEDLNERARQNIISALQSMQNMVLTAENLFNSEIKKQNVSMLDIAFVRNDQQDEHVFANHFRDPKNEITQNIQYAGQHYVGFNQSGSYISQTICICVASGLGCNAPNATAQQPLSPDDILQFKTAQETLTQVTNDLLYPRCVSLENRIMINYITSKYLDDRYR